MDQRQARILSSVVEEYTKTAFPVGSRVIAENYVEDVSPATVRNEMAQLEKDGYLYQPHVSSGRIPTDKGYRYFIEVLMEKRDLPYEEAVEMQKELLQLRAKNLHLTRTMAKLLSAMSGQMALSGIVDKDEYYEFGLRHLLEEGASEDINRMCRFVEALDSIDKRLDMILEKLSDDKTRIFVGCENPIKEMSEYSMIVSPIYNELGERGIIAIIGPKRMPYARNKALVEFLKKWTQLPMILIVVGSVHCIVLS